MGDKSAIEWTRGDDGVAGATWNPIRARHRVTGKVGWFCIHKSAGCKHCYAEAMNKWRGNGAPYTAPALKDVEIFLNEDTLTDPLHWKAPRKIFVCSMTDLFGEFVPDEFIERVVGIIGSAPRHTFQVLTKRSERMRDWFTKRVNHGWSDQPPIVYEQTGFPPRNLWCGVSVEDQATADERIWHLLHVPAAVRFVSYEPALAGVDFTRLDYTAHLREFMRRAVGDDGAASVTGPAWINALSGEWSDGEDGGTEKDRRLSWLITGGESGSEARPPHPDWFRVARDHCIAAGIPFFFKQWGEWAPHPHPPFRGTNTGGGLFVLPSGHLGNQGDYWDGAAAAMDRVGKKAAGRTLDGREWSEFPR
jgi:protein gp37